MVNSESLEDGLTKFAEYGHDLTLLGFKEAKDCNFLTPEGIAQYESMRDIQFSQLKPEIQSAIKKSVLPAYETIIRAALGAEKDG